MDFSVLPCRQAKMKPAPPLPAPPPPPKAQSFPACIPEFMKQLPQVPGSRNVEMLFRWNLGEDMDGYYGQNPRYASRGMAPGPFGSMAPPLPPSQRYVGLPPPPPPPLLLGGGMHGHVHPFGQGMHGHNPPFGYGMQEYDYPFSHGYGDYGFDPYGPQPPHHYGYYQSCARDLCSC